MATELFREFTLEAGRQLPNLPAGHPCSRMHGHTFRIQVFIGGEIQPRSGWIMDFAELDTKIHAIREILDHQVLNGIPGLENPTTELLAQWIWQRLKPELPGLTRIVIQENPYSGCIYTGD